MDRLVVATHNVKKGGEMVTILRDLLPEIEILTLVDFVGAPEPEETGRDYAENAAIKSESAARFTGLPCLADDAGLEIDALDGAPGHHSKRFGGEDLPFPKKMARILELLERTPDERRTARFSCCVALSIPGSVAGFRRVWPEEGESAVHAEPGGQGRTYLFQAVREGVIAREPKGSGGFGYDPIFFLPELGTHMAELSPQEKHAVSHRGIVLRKFASFAKDRLTNR